MRYPTVTREVAAALKVPLLDMNRSSEELANRLGPEASKSLYMWVPAGRWPTLCDIGAPEYLIETARRGLQRRLMDFPVHSETQLVILREQHDSQLARDKHLRETRFYGEDDEDIRAILEGNDGMPALSSRSVS